LAALAGAVVVVQGREQSGALLTADAARRMGRPVGAVPWDCRDPLGASPHALIRSGAAVLVRGVDDVLELVGVGKGAPAPAAVPAASMTSVAVRAASPDFPAESFEERLYRALRHRPRPLEAVALDASLSVADATAALVFLELGGRARRDPGGRVRRIGRS
jgi:DNA processing protein